MSNEAGNSDLFAKYSPEDFDFAPPRAVWEQPCWIRVCNSFRAVDQAAKSEYYLPLTFDFRIDAFARISPDEQLDQQFWRLCKHAGEAGGRMWLDFLYQRNNEFRHALDDTTTLFTSPFRYVPRSEFESVKLDVILREDPERMVIYVAEDADSYGREIYALRIHSSLWYRVADQKYLWFQKILPWALHPEDVVPWFHATIKKLPKKSQPRNLDVWDEMLLRAEPDFAPLVPNGDQKWSDRSKLILVFGTRDEIGYAALYHLERDRIKSLVRNGTEISIRATIHNQYEKDPEKLWWIIHLLTPSERHAERLEGRLLSGGQVHFGLEDDICGMIACNQNHIDAVNVEPDALKRHCGKPGMVLALVSPPRQKHKTYCYWPENEPLTEGLGLVT